MEAFLRSLDEIELCRRAVCPSGAVEPDAFGVLYERHAPMPSPFRSVGYTTGCKPEDVTAQTFLQALGALSRYQPRGMPIRNWFLTIAANVIRDTYRRPDALTDVSVLVGGAVMTTGTTSRA